MKIFKKLLVMVICLLMVPNLVSAASGTIKVTGTSTAVTGNTVTITVTLASSTAIGSWEMSLNYDKSYLQLVSTTAEAGGTRMANSSSGVKSKSYTYKFKALKTGSTNVSVGSYLAYAYSDMSELSLSVTNKTVRIITQAELEASYSKDNDLKSLGVDGFELSPAFAKDVTEYSVVVPEDTKEINITALEDDSRASLSGSGVQTVTSGTNTFQIVVRAENGAEKTYTLTVEVKDANPINVTLNNENYTVVKIKENLPDAPMYQEYTVKIGEFEIPGYKNDNTDIVLVGLKNSAGEIDLFIYDEESQNYSVYKEIGVNKIIIYPLETTELIDGYISGKVEIDGKEYDAFYLSTNSRTVLIYGVNIETGEKGFYIYDKEDQVVLKYDDEYVNVLNEKIQLFSYIILGFSGIFIVLLLIIILIIKPKKKKNKKVKELPVEEKVNKKEDKNEIVEEDYEETTILDYDKKKKKTKKKHQK